MNPRKRCGKKTHGKSYSREYRSWQSMIYRCLNPKSHKYASYGARGIKICERWLTFAEFYADMGYRPEGTTLDRINNDLGYEPGNCRWADGSTQARNQRKRRGGTSKYVGVSATPFGTWRSSIRSEGVNVHLGTFKTEEEASQAYQKARSELEARIEEKMAKRTQP